jgi:hypothetical protein
VSLGPDGYCYLCRRGSALPGGACNRCGAVQPPFALPKPAPAAESAPVQFSITCTRKDDGHPHVFRVVVQSDTEILRAYETGGLAVLGRIERELDALAPVDKAGRL